MHEAISTAGKPPVARGRLLYVVTEDWYFLSHRLPMARAARDAGFEVHVAANVVEGAAAIEAEGFALHPIPILRGRLSPLASFRTIRALRRIHRRIRPVVVHHVALQPVVLGCLAALDLPAAWVNALTGLGYAFASTSAKARRMRWLITAAMRFLLSRRSSLVLVQNEDDRSLVTSIGIAPSQIVLIPGSGIDVAALTPLPEPAGPPTVAFVGRLLAYKGIRSALDAHALLRARGSNVELLIAGAPDPANPDSLNEAEAKSWSQRPGVTWLGHVRSISAVWARAHIAVLPSRHEGMPKNLLEAAACGRPMVATDVPGCRDIVRHGETGLLVPLDDTAALATAIDTLAKSPDLRARYGDAARELAVERFSDAAVGRQTVELYLRLAPQLEPTPSER
jgi:glycosyltransferase involved in cell wall biosynthesis